MEAVTSWLYSVPTTESVVLNLSASKYQSFELSMSMENAGLPCTIAHPWAPYFGSSVVPVERHIHSQP